MKKHSHNETPLTETRNALGSLLRYRLILIILFPVLIGFTVFQTIKYRSFKYLLQRLSISTGSHDKIDVWIHAASVGEVNAAIPLIQAITKLDPSAAILMTTTTPTGARVIQTQRIPNTRHCYLPLDYAIFVSSFLNKTQPRCAIIMETEIWPNLFRLCYKNRISLYLVNGRLSHRTLNTTQWVKSLYASTLQYPTLILTRSDRDTKAYIALGAPAEKVKTIGNIKFAMQFNAPATHNQFTNRPYLLAASTHNDEELQIASLWSANREKFTHHLLVIAPRHPQRLNKILNQLQSLEFNIAIRSRNDQVTDQTDIYIVDTIGELMEFMNNAQLVFMGGSLVPVGGHNVIEPANLAKAMVFGPYMANFENEVQLLLNHHAAIQVENARQLLMPFSELLQDERKRSQLGKKARELVEKQKNIADRYAAEIKNCLEK